MWWGMWPIWIENSEKLKIKLKLKTGECDEECGQLNWKQHASLLLRWVIPVCWAARRAGGGEESNGILKCVRHVNDLLCDAWLLFSSLMRQISHPMFWHVIWLNASLAGWYVYSFLKFSSLCGNCANVQVVETISVFIACFYQIETCFFLQNCCNFFVSLAFSSFGGKVA